MPDPGLISVADDGLVAFEAEQLVSVVPDETGPIACCCEDLSSTWYYLACPCIAYAGAACAVPDAPCVFIDARSILSDSALQLGQREADGIFATWNSSIGSWTISTYVQIAGVCYALLSAMRFSDTPGVGFPLPPDAVRVGGPGATIDKRANCLDGCAPVNVGGTHYEIFPCDGCRGPITGRRFVCARSVFGLFVVAIGTADSGSWCINRSAIYSQAQAEALGTIVNVNPLLIIADVGGRLGSVPALSCCFGIPIPQCRPACSPPCMRGLSWKLFSRGYGLVDVCCGRRVGFSYSAVLSFNKTRTYPPNSNGFSLVQTETASVASITDDADCNYVLISINYSRSDNTGYTESLPFVVRVRKRCCLDFPETNVSDFPGFSYNLFTPLPYYYEPNGNSFGGFGYWRRVPWDPDPNVSLLRGWFESGWGFVFQFSGRSDDASSYTAGGSSSGDCNSWTFNYSESQTFASGGSISTSVSLALGNVLSPGFPCGNFGNCAGGAWTSFDLEDLVP